jgi:hypothetical protein
MPTTWGILPKRHGLDKWFMMVLGMRNRSFRARCLRCCGLALFGRSREPFAAVAGCASLCQWGCHTALHSWLSPKPRHGPTSAGLFLWGAAVLDLGLSGPIFRAREACFAARPPPNSARRRSPREWRQPVTRSGCYSPVDHPCNPCGRYRVKLHAVGFPSQFSESERDFIRLGGWQGRKAGRATTIWGLD